MARQTRTVHFRTGNIVRWGNSLWIVQEHREAGVRENGQKIAEGLELISAEGSNVTALPTTEWPADPKKRLSSVEWVADDMMDFIHRKVSALFKGKK